MKSFLIKVIWFATPLVVLFIPPIVALALARENYFDLDEVILSKDRYLIGYAYNEDNYGYLKWKTVTTVEKKEVMALGSSRVLSFTDSMFDAPFYNAGNTISSIKEFKPFLQGIPKEKYPRYLIVGVDQWMFNPAWGKSKAKVPKEKWENDFAKLPKPVVYWNVYQDLFSGKYGYGQFLKENSFLKVGLNSFVNNKGMRNDGSFYYGTQIEKLINNDSTANDFHYKDTYQRIKKGDRRFQYGDEISQDAVTIFGDFLKYCKGNDIMVIAFLPPFADQVYEKMMETGQYQYLNKIHSSIRPFFEKHGFEVYDFSKVSLCNSSDEETLDGFHGGEVTYLKLLMKMLEAGSALNGVSRLEKLKDDLAKIRNRFVAYSYSS